MAKAAALEIYYDKDGLPGKKHNPDDKLDLGEFELEFGKEIIIHYRNPNHNVVANIKDLHVDTKLISFSGPDEIFPMETVKTTFQIKPLPDFLKLDKIDFGDVSQVEDYLKALKLIDEELNTSKVHGKIEWFGINVTMDRTTRTYGWGM